MEKQEQNKIYEAIISESFNTDDLSYRPICNNLRSLGYNIQGE